MMEYGRHFFIFLFILALALCVLLVAFCSVVRLKNKTPFNTKLQGFSISYLANVLMVFSYFYKVYFITLGDLQVVINVTLINITLLFTMYWGISALYSAVNIKLTSKFRLLLLGSGIVYSAIYSLLLSSHSGGTVPYPDPYDAVLFVGSELLFTCVTCYYCWHFLFILRRETEIQANLKIIAKTISIILSLYMIFNFAVDTYFGMSGVRAMIYGVNIYHLSVFLFIALNVILLIHYYKYSLGISGMKSESLVFAESSGSAPEKMNLEKISLQYGLTQRETELTNLVIEGKTTPEIAAILNISPNTAKRHLTNIYRKLQISNRFELICKIQK